MEKIAAHNDKIHPFADGILFQNVNPGVEEIARRFVKLVARAAEMNVGNVQEFHNIIIANQPEKTQ
jgi:hypothetical protein